MLVCTLVADADNAGLQIIPGVWRMIEMNGQMNSLCGHTLFSSWILNDWKYHLFCVKFFRHGGTFCWEKKIEYFEENRNNENWKFLNPIYVADIQEVLSEILFLVYSLKQVLRSSDKNYHLLPLFITFNQNFQR